MNASFERYTGFPLRTRIGPPPIASETVPQPGWRISRSVTVVPIGASAWSFVAAIPRATSTAVPGAIATGPFWLTLTTGAARSAFGVAAGNGESTSAIEPAICGVERPQSVVKREIPFFPGAWFRKLRVRRWPSPRHVPRNLIRRTSSVPSSVIPALERDAFGGVTRTPSRSRTPLGRPVESEKRSPFTPTVVLVVDSRRSIDDTVSLPVTDPFERTGLSR